MIDAAYHREWRAKHGEKYRERERARYYKRKGKDPELLARNRAQKKAWRDANPEAIHFYQLEQALRNYGLTLDDYSAEAAKGCAICKKKSGWKGRFHLDHDHKTGKFRGLLCPHCNHGLGCFRDDVDSLLNAVIYLKGK